MRSLDPELDEYAARKTWQEPAWFDRIDVRRAPREQKSRERVYDRSLREDVDPDEIIEIETGRDWWSV